jgi:hypothetical protein
MTGSGGGGGGGGSSAGGSRGSSSLDAAYLCYVLLGAGTLFPWNALITAADYWEARYPVSDAGRPAPRVGRCACLPPLPDKTCRDTRMHTSWACLLAVVQG